MRSLWQKSLGTWRRLWAFPLCQGLNWDPMVSRSHLEGAKGLVCVWAWGVGMIQREPEVRDAGASNLWEEECVVRAGLGLGEVIPEKAGEEGRVLTIISPCWGHRGATVGFEAEEWYYQICTLGSPLWLMWGEWIGGKKAGGRENHWGLLKYWVVTAPEPV